MNKKPDIKHIEKISKALGDPYRLKIMDEIKKRKDDWMPCFEIVDMLHIAQSTVSHHMKQLVDADLLIAEKEGRCAMYKLNKEVISGYVKFLNEFES